MSMYLQKVAAIFDLVIGNLKDEGTILALKPLDTLIQLYAAQARSGQELAQTAYCYDLDFS